jgi:hypothetical protein
LTLEIGEFKGINSSLSCCESALEEREEEEVTQRGRTEPFSTATLKQNIDRLLLPKKTAK